MLGLLRTIVCVLFMYDLLINDAASVFLMRGGFKCNTLECHRFLVWRQNSNFGFIIVSLHLFILLFVIVAFQRSEHVDLNRFNIEMNH